MNVDTTGIQDETPDGMGPRPHACVALLQERSVFGTLTRRALQLEYPQSEVVVPIIGEPEVERPYEESNPPQPLSATLRAEVWQRTGWRQLGRVTAEWWLRHVGRTLPTEGYSHRDDTIACYFVGYERIA